MKITPAYRKAGALRNLAVMMMNMLVEREGLQVVVGPDIVAGVEVSTTKLRDRARRANQKLLIESIVIGEVMIELEKARKVQAGEFVQEVGTNRLTEKIKVRAIRAREEIVTLKMPIEEAMKEGRRVTMMIVKEIGDINLAETNTTEIDHGKEIETIIIIKMTDGK